MAWVTKSSTENYQDKEPQREYSKAEKAGNWWHYNKVIVAVALVAAVMLAWLAHDIFFRVKPDYMVGYVGRSGLPEDTTDALGAALAEFGEDVNGDGKVVVQVNQFVVSLEQTPSVSEMDPYEQMAGLTQLSADIASASGSYIYLLEDPEVFENYSGVLRYLDGTLPDDSAGTENLDWTQMVYRWTDCPVLTGLDLGAYTGLTMVDNLTGENQDVLAPLYVGFRGTWDGEVSKEGQAAEAMWAALTAGASSTAGQE